MLDSTFNPGWSHDPALKVSNPLSLFSFHATGQVYLLLFLSHISSGLDVPYLFTSSSLFSPQPAVAAVRREQAAAADGALAAETHLKAGAEAMVVEAFLPWPDGGGTSALSTRVETCGDADKLLCINVVETCLHLPILLPRELDAISRPGRLEEIEQTWLGIAATEAANLGGNEKGLWGGASARWRHARAYERICRVVIMRLQVQMRINWMHPYGRWTFAN